MLSLGVPDSCDRFLPGGNRINRIWKLKHENTDQGLQFPWNCLETWPWTRATARALASKLDEINCAEMLILSGNLFEGKHLSKQVFRTWESQTMEKKHQGARVCGTRMLYQSRCSWSSYKIQDPTIIWLRNLQSYIYLMYIWYYIYIYILLYIYILYIYYI